MRWVEFGGEIWPVPDDVALTLGLGQAGSPGAPGWTGPVSEVNPPPTVVMPVPVRPRWEKRYVCDWRWVRIPPKELPPPARTTFGIKPTGGAIGPPAVGIEGLFYD